LGSGSLHEEEKDAMKDQKILITGVTSPVGRALAKSLCSDNEVWGLARFSDPLVRTALDESDITTVSLDIGTGDFSELPADFTHVLHLAYFRGPRPEDLVEAMRVNAEGTGLLFGHCRKAKAALYMSSHVIYNFYEDPWYHARESDAFGSASPSFSATAGVSKISGEAIARYCAREFDLPMVIARLNAPYGSANGLLATAHMGQVVAGQTVNARWDPEPYTPIHLDDMCGQVEAMLDAASTPANIVNWAGDEAVTVQQWAQMAAGFAGKEANVEVRESPGAKRGSCADTTKRKSITGPCKVTFKEGFRRTFEERHGPALNSGDD
jgi:nucleoside-diphosphate-sugar epimerase